MKASVNIFWFRRDLRLTDNAGLYHALKADRPVMLIFIFDKNILGRLENKQDARVTFIYKSLQDIQRKLAIHKSSMEIFFGNPSEVYAALIKVFDIGKVFTNEDYEPYARERDAEVAKLLENNNICFHSFKDQVIFSRQELMKDDDTPYTVFTPYSNKWMAKLRERPVFYLKPYPVEKYIQNLYRQETRPIPTLESMGFCHSVIKFPASKADSYIIRKYARLRDFPGLDSTSRLGIHLRFGTISIRQLAREAVKLSDVFLNELIWRDFYQMILWHFPKVGKGHAFKAAYEKIPWRNHESEFTRWCEGKTGYPLVDAGMRQLNETGFMHNRVRMVTASFLSKHLLIDWRWGEAYFAARLLDFDLASNNGGWQWAASTGCDAVPYFRIFNPTIQLKKFDPEGTYIKKWLPDFQLPDYPPPIVEHAFARDRAIRAYREALAVSRKR
jgi:deoxyribodipyrimidine photo-lyase